MTSKLLLASLVLWTGLQACSSDSSSAASASPDILAADAQGAAAPDIATADATPAGLTCAPVPQGAVKLDAGFVVYQNGTADAQVTAGADGCAAGLTVTVETATGCRMALEMTVKDGAFAPASGTLTADAGCGEAIPSDQTGAWDLDASQSTLALLSSPAAPDPSTASCVSGELDLIGALVFKRFGNELTIALDSLSIGGTILYSPGAGACAKAPVTCDGLTCGRDPFGTECGECSGALTCIDGGCAMPPGPTWTTFAKGFFVKYCNACHSPSGQAKADFNQLDVVRQRPLAIKCGVSPTFLPGCEGQKSPGGFPVGSGPKPTTDQRLRLVQWIEDGTPE